MAFDASIVVLKRQYNQSMDNIVLGLAHQLLHRFHIVIEKQVSTKEYEQMTSSKDINRYVRIQKTDMKEQKDKAYELVKVGTSRLQTFEQFASAKYGFFSISGLDDSHTVIWFSFHTRLYRAFGEFKDFSYQLARELSVRLGIESYVLSASSFSRNADKFIMYVRGKERNKLSSKGALTQVRDLYGLDINELMINVDKNMAIHYAPQDYKLLVQEINEQKARYEEWKKHKPELKKNEHGKMIENKEDGSEYIDTFEEENRIVMESLRDRLDVVEKALREDPIGGVVYFKMTDKGPGREGVPENERTFGRDITPDDAPTSSQAP